MKKNRLAFFTPSVFVLFFSPILAAAEIRDIRVKTLGDEEYRQDPGWTTSADNILKVVSADFERLFGIRFLATAHDNWISDDSVHSVETLAAELDARLDKSDADVVFAITAQKDLDAGYSGYSLFREGLVLLRDMPDRDELSRILKHELGHLFGAVHVDDPSSVMGPFIQGRDFDDENLQAVRLNRGRSFHTVEFPVPKDLRPRAIALYERMCDAIRFARAGPKTDGNAGSRVVALLGENGGRDRSELDDAFVLLAHLTLEEKEYDKTLSVCRQALALNPRNLDTQNLMGIALRRMGRVEEAIEKYKSILEQKPGHARVHYNLGIALAKKGDLEAARAAYETALELKPNFAEARNNLGETYLKIGRLEDAERELRRAIGLFDEYALAHSNLAEVLCRKNDYPAALAEAERAIALSPDLSDPRNILGNIHRRLGKNDEAVRDYRRALALDPGYEKAYYNLGVSSLDEGKNAEARAHFQKAVELNPAFAEARASLGYCLLRDNKFDEAIAEILAAQQLGYRPAKTFLNLSTAYLRNGQTEQAVAQARKAVKLEPGLAMARNNLGVALLRQGERGNALREFERAIEIDPKNREAYLNLGSLHLQADEIDEALRAYLKATALGADDGLVFNNLAVIYFRKGQYALAKSYADKALDAGFEVHPDFLSALKKKIK